MSNHKKPMTKPREICFMIMPFGTKPADHLDGAPEKVDFDALWDKAFKPALEELEYVAVRADQDQGSLIIKDMLERIVASDLVLADVSIANANVYYELGIRHAAKRSQCIVISADWAKPKFDIDQVRRLCYPLGERSISDQDAQTVKEMVKAAIQKYKDSETPVFATIENFPNPPQQELASFKNDLIELEIFQKNVQEIRHKSGEAKNEAREQLTRQYEKEKHLSPTVWIELLNLAIECSAWPEALRLINRFPEVLKSSEAVIEKKALALSKLGDDEKSLAELDMLIQKFGETSERLGLVGGRFKALYYKDKDKDKNKALYHLHQAIENYEKGMHLDLNQYFPGCNLPRLLRARGGQGDSERAEIICTLIGEICRVVENQGRADLWLNSTRLGLAFDTANVALAQDMAMRLRGEKLADWMSATTMIDLALSLSQVKDGEIRQQLQTIFDSLHHKPAPIRVS